MTYYSTPPRSDELWHHGIKGMKWGIRKYQNEDGSLTPAGERHYYRKDGSLKRRGAVKMYKAYKKQLSADSGKYTDKVNKSAYDYADKHKLSYDSYDPNWRKRKNDHVSTYSKMLDDAERLVDSHRASNRNKLKAYEEELNRQMQRRKQKTSNNTNKQEMSYKNDQPLKRKDSAKMYKAYKQELQRKEKAYRDKVFKDIPWQDPNAQAEGYKKVDAYKAKNQKLLRSYETKLLSQMNIPRALLSKDEKNRVDRYRKRNSN